MYRIILSLFICFSFCVQAQEVGYTYVKQIKEAYSQGVWDNFLQEMEADYQEYLSQNDPIEKVCSLKDPAQYAKRYNRLLLHRYEEALELSRALSKALKKQKMSDLWIAKTLESINISSFMLDPDGEYPALLPLELGAKMEEIGYKSRPDFNREVEEIEEGIRPIQIAYTVKSHLARSKNAGHEALLVLELEKWKKIEEALSFKNRDMASFQGLETGEVRFVCFLNGEHFLYCSLEALRFDFANLLELVEGKRKPENKHEKTAIRILKQHKKILSEEWDQEFNELRHCYLEK